MPQSGPPPATKGDLPSLIDVLHGLQATNRYHKRLAHAVQSHLQLSRWQLFACYKLCLVGRVVLEAGQRHDRVSQTNAGCVGIDKGFIRRAKHTLDVQLSKVQLDALQQLGLG